MAEERFPACLVLLISVTRSERRSSREGGQSFSASQNSVSALTLVLLPDMTIDRLNTGDFMNCSNEILLQPAFELAAFALANLNLDRIRAGGLNFALRRITWSNDRVKKQPANRRACDRHR